MSDMITAEAAAKLLDKEAFDAFGAAEQIGVLKSEVASMPGSLKRIGDTLVEMAEKVVKDKIETDRTIRDLARTVIALHAQIADARAERDSIGAMYATVVEENKALEAERDAAFAQLADAKAAQAMVAERAAERANERAKSHTGDLSVGSGRADSREAWLRAAVESRGRTRCQQGARGGAMLTKKPQQTWVFDRYVNGVLMAEGVEVTRAASFEEATVIAARLAARGPNGETPVLVLCAALDALARVATLEKVGLIREAEWATFRDALISERDALAAELAAAQQREAALHAVATHGADTIATVLILDIAAALKGRDRVVLTNDETSLGPRILEFVAALSNNGRGE